MATDEKIICPNCDKETVKGDKCTLCGFALEGFEQFVQWQDAAEKQREKKRKAQQTEADKNKPAAKRSFFSHLGGK